MGKNLAWICSHLNIFRGTYLPKLEGKKVLKMAKLNPFSLQFRGCKTLILSFIEVMYRCLFVKVAPDSVFCVSLRHVTNQVTQQRTRHNSSITCQSHARSFRFPRFFACMTHAPHHHSHRVCWMLLPLHCWQQWLGWGLPHNPRGEIVDTKWTPRRRTWRASPLPPPDKAPPGWLQVDATAFKRAEVPRLSYRTTDYFVMAYLNIAPSLGGTI